MNMDKVKEQVKALLKAENINIDDVESAKAALSTCVLHKKCLEAYHSILKQKSFKAERGKVDKLKRP